MSKAIELTDDEWSIVHELLERERHELPAEVRRMMNKELKETLKARLETVDATLQKISAELNSQAA